MVGRAARTAGGRVVAQVCLAWSVALSAACGCADAAVESGTTQAHGSARGAGAVPGGEAAGEPEGGGTVVVALRRLPAALDPLGDLGVWGERIADDLVFEGLVRRSSHGYPWVKPALADRCEVDREHDTREVVCHLRTGAKFHDGSDVTADDVRYSVSHFIDPRRGWVRLRHGLDSLRSVEVVDGPGGGIDAERDPGRWIRITLSEREPLALERLAAIKIVPRKAHRGRRGIFGRAPIGTGPMRVVSLSPDRVVLENAGERPAGTASRMVFRAEPDGAVALTLLRRGEVHLLAEVAPVHVPEELAKPGMAPRFVAYLTSPPRFDLLVYNVRRGVISGPRLRRALDDAVPRGALAEVYPSPGRKLVAPVDDHVPGPIDLEALARSGPMIEPTVVGLPTQPRAEDDAKGALEAARVLDQLDWKLSRGLRRRGTGHLRVTLMWDGRSGLASDVARSLRTAWRGLGIQVVYATASWSYLRGPLRRGEFDVALMRLYERSDADLFPLFHSRGSLNISGVSDQTLDAALERWRLSVHPDDRDAAKADIAARIAQLGPVTVLHAPHSVMLASRDVTGIEFVDDVPRLDRLGLAVGATRQP